MIFILATCLSARRHPLSPKTALRLGRRTVHIHSALASRRRLFLLAPCSIELLDLEDTVSRPAIIFISEYSSSLSGIARAVARTYPDRAESRPRSACFHSASLCIPLPRRPTTIVSRLSHARCPVSICQLSTQSERLFGLRSLLHDVTSSPDQPRRIPRATRPSRSRPSPSPSACFSLCAANERAPCAREIAKRYHVPRDRPGQRDCSLRRVLHLARCFAAARGRVGIAARDFLRARHRRRRRHSGAHSPGHIATPACSMASADRNIQTAFLCLATGPQACPI
jgi:hypothetical protein